MLPWLSRRVVKDAWYVVGTWVVLSVVLVAVASGALGGGGLFARLQIGGPAIPGTQSAQGEQILDTLAGDAETVSLLVTGVDISTPEAQQATASALTSAHSDLHALAGEQNVLDPFVVPGMLSEPAAQALASSDLDGFLVIVTVNPNGTEVAAPEDRAYAQEVADLVRRVENRLDRIPGELREVSPTAAGVVSDEGLVTRELNDRVERDLVRGELVAVPLVLGVMVVVFGGFLMAGMPLIGALAAITGSLGALYLLSFVVEIQSFSVNIVAVVGLGLSVDYGLLMASRYREELNRERDELESSAEIRFRRRRTGRRDPLIAECMTTTLATAGRTVLFSGATVGAALMALTLIGPGVLWSVGVAGIAVVVVATAASLTLVPALLVLPGRRLQRPPLLRLRRRSARRDGGHRSDSGVFSGTARLVQRMPWVVLVACVALLVALASPLLGMHMLTSTTQILPQGSDQHTYVSVLQEDYPAAAGEDATLVISSTGERVTSYINEQVAPVDGVTGILRSATAGEYTVVYLDLEGEPSSATAENAVSDILASPAPADIWVTGQAASQVDFRQTVVDGLPMAGGVLLLVTFVLMFLMTGSAVAPFKVLLTNTVSLAASLGVLVWIFQEGHLAGFLGVTPIGGVEAHVVLAAVAVGFGLATDYEVFILARIKECRDAGQDDDAAVRAGLQRSGRVVTSAALVMVIVFMGFVSGDLLVVKELGVALAVMVLLDATVVRLLLVPATMGILGGWSWWAPFRRNTRVETPTHVADGDVTVVGTAPAPASGLPGPVG